MRPTLIGKLCSWGKGEKNLLKWDRNYFSICTYAWLSRVFDFLLLLLQSSKEPDRLPVKGIITSSLPSTLVDLDTNEVKQTHPFNEHVIIRKEFIDIELALLLEEVQDAPMFPALWVRELLMLFPIGI